MSSAGAAMTTALMAKALEQTAWGLIVRPQVDPRQDQRKALGDPETARWNRLLLALRHAAAAAGAALRRKENAAPEAGDGLPEGEDRREALGALDRADASRAGGWRRWWCSTRRIIRRSPSGSCLGSSRCRGWTQGRRSGRATSGRCSMLRSRSATSTKQLKGDRREGFLRELATWAEVGLALTTAAPGCWWPPSGSRRRFVEWWEASPLGGCRRGSRRGISTRCGGATSWKTAQWLGVVGRTMPQEGDLRDLAAVIDGQPAEHGGFTLGDAVWADAKNAEREWVRERTVPGRADGLEQALLDMIGGGRARPRRSAGCGWCGGHWRGWRSTF